MGPGRPDGAKWTPRTRALLAGLCLVLGTLPVAHGAAAGGSPDLVARSATAKGGSVFVGSRVTLRAGIANLGSGPAGKSTVSFYLSRDKGWSSADVLLGKAKVPSLPSRARRTVSGRARVPQSAPRLTRLRVLACADGGFKFTEGNEGNNCAAGRAKLIVADPTPFGAIDADVLRQRISAERALTYKLFAGFGDKRLPKRYDFKGDSTGGSLTAVTNHAVQEFAGLSPETQAVIQPFLIPPAYEGSYAARPTAGRSLRRDLDSCSVRQPQWIPVAADVGAGTGAGGAVVWWNTSRPGDEAAANRLAGELATQIWPKLTALMGTAPVSDAAHRCSGIDGRLDVYLDPIPDPVTSQFTASCAPAASDITISASEPRGALAHEFMHVLQKTFTRLTPCQQFAYMDDATATWAEDFVYAGDHSEHQYPEMLRYPDIRFNYPPTAGYPAWVLFYSAAKKLGSAVVPAFHTAAQGEPPLDALDSAMTIDDAWPQFARDGWNKALSPALTQSFFNWDAFRVRPEVEKRPYALVGARKTYPLPIELLGMGRQYQHIDLSDRKAKLVTFEHPAPTEVDPKLRTYAFFKIARGPWKGEDWTGRDEVEFCRDNADEDVREVILVHTTTTPPAGTGGADLVAKTDKAKLRLADKCDPDAEFDVSSVSGSYTGTVHRERPETPCTTDLSVHWDATLGSGAKPASLAVADDSGDGPPILSFSASRIPLRDHGGGTATITCSGDGFLLNGTATCQLSGEFPELLSVFTTGQPTKPDPMRLGWTFAFPNRPYDPGANSGEPRNCSESGPRPPDLQGEYSPTIAVGPGLTPADPEEDPTYDPGAQVEGTKSVPRSTFGGNTVTLEFSGSGTSHYDYGDRSMSAQWSYSMVVTFTRR